MNAARAAELRWEDATAVAARVRCGDLTVRESVEAAIERIRELNPQLNAVVLEWFDVAMGRAAELDREFVDAPFRGVPFLLKDLGVAVAGRPLYLGNRALRDADFRPQWTSELARRFAALGLVTLGSTNTPEMGAQTTTQPLVYGPARNPWDLDLSPSGSSGGAAGAVAAGLVPIAHGNDYLGSIRLPAAWNGIIGMIASRGRVPLGPDATSRMSRESVLVRSVRDLATTLDGVSGYAAGELWMQAPPAHPFIEALTTPVRTLRVGLLREAPDGSPVDASIAAAVSAVGCALEDLGHHVELRFPPALFEESRAPRLDRGSDYRRRIRIIERLLGRDVGRDDVEPFLWEMAQPDGETVDSYLEAEAWQQGWSARVTGWWEHDGYDMLITPTIPMLPQRVDALDVPREDPRRFVQQIARHVVFTSPFNVTGQPALALPWGPPPSPSTPPPSVQIVGARGMDHLVLAVAAQLEASRPSAHHPRIGPLPLRDREGGPV